MIERTGRTVLVVDDSEANIDILVEILGDRYEVSVALDGESALGIVEEDPPNLILLDIMIPGMVGYEVCRRIKSDDNTRNIPIVFVSAEDQIDQGAAGPDIDVVNYLTKPVDPDLVHDIVRKLLS